MPTVIADLQIMPAERRFTEHLEQFTSEQHGKTGNRHAAVDVAVHQDTNSLREIWAALESTNSNSLHQSLAWCEAWLSTHNTIARIVTVTVSEKVVAILPLEIKPALLGPVAEFIGADFSNINTGILNAQFAQDASPEQMKTIVEAIVSTLSNEAVMISLTNMPDTWQGIVNPFRYCLRAENQNHAYQLPLLDTFEDTLAQINAKRRRKKFRKSVKTLEEYGGFEHVVAKTAQDKDVFLKTFFEQKQVRFQAAGLPDVFAPQDVQSFFHLLAQNASPGDDSLLKIHALKLNDGRILALAGVSRKGNHVICQFSSIDETVAAEASAGELLFYLMIEQAHAEGAKIFDFGIGYQRYKSSWCPVETVHYDILIPMGLRGWISAINAMLKNRAKTFIKRHEGLYSIVQRLRAR